jgi:hypothetical protein
MTFAFDIPPSTICPRLTMHQARTLSHLKRNGNHIVGYEAVVGIDSDGQRINAVVFVTSRTEFAVNTDGTTLDLDALEADGSLPPSPARGRRRSLRNHPAGTSQEQ